MLCGTHLYKKLLKNAENVAYNSKGQFTPRKVKQNTNHMISLADKYLVVWDGTPGLVKNYVSTIMALKKPRS